MQATIEDFIRSHQDSVTTNDPTTMLRTVTPDCVRLIGPASLVKSMSPPGAPPQDAFTMDNGAFIAHARSQHDLIKDMTSTLLDTVIDTAKMRAAVRFNNAFKVGKTDIVLENTFFLEFTEDGTKIKLIREILDVPTVQVMRQAFEDARGEAIVGQ